MMMVSRIFLVLGLALIAVYLIMGDINVGGVIGATIGCVYAFYRFRDDENEEEQG